MGAKPGVRKVEGGLGIATPAQGGVGTQARTEEKGSINHLPGSWRLTALKS